MPNPSSAPILKVLAVSVVPGLLGLTMPIPPLTLSGINEASNLPSAPVAGITGSGPDVAVKEELRK